MIRSPVATVSLLVLVSGCSEEAPADLHGQRSGAYLHSLRDSKDGYEAAIELLETVVRHEDAAFGDWLNLARALVLHPNRGAEAIAAIDKARAIGSDQRGLRALDYVEGLFHKTKLDHARAHDQFERVVASRPDHPQVLYQCAFAAENAGRLPAAKKHYERLIELKLLISPAAYRLSRVESALGDPAAAQKAVALFQSLENAGEEKAKPETIKCDLSDLDLRRFDRKSVEPPKVALGWTSVATLAKRASESSGFARVLPCPGTAPERAELFLLGERTLWRVQKDSPVDTGVSLRGSASGVVLDIDNKAGPEVLIADDDGFKALTREAGAWERATFQFPNLPDAKAPSAMAAFDVDHDGDVDVVLVTGGPDRRLQVLRNNGDGAFEWKTPFDVRVDVASSSATRIDGHDVDQANDLDLVSPGESAAILSLNLRGEKFRSVALPDLAGRPLLVVEDFDNDGAPDVFGAGGRAGWTLSINADSSGSSYQARFAKPENSPADAPTVVDVGSGDIDNDGDLDLILATRDGVVVLRNTNGGDLVADPLVPVPSGVRCLEVVDLEGDGVLEVALIEGSGGARILRPKGALFGSVVLAPVGRKDNLGAVGTVVEAFAGRAFQSKMLKGPFGVHFGLGNASLTQFDGVRMRWPAGIRQAVPRSKFPSPDQRRVVFNQIEGLVASCPFLYVKGRDGWTFLTDVLGIAPLAEWLPPGGKAHLDPEEFVRIPGDALAVVDGRVTLAITEELKETAYLDRAELYFVDHPRSEVLMLDENVLQDPLNELEVHAFDQSSFAALATATVRGADHLATVAAVDRTYLHPYIPTRSQWGGWSEPHTIDIETAAPADVLILTGRLAWYDSTVTFALTQNGRTWSPMRIERVHDDGRAEVIVADAGLPTGMDRTMLVPLGGDPLPAGTRLRIHGQHRFLWDRICTAQNPEEKPTEHPARPATLVRAEMFHHGYSKIVGDPGGHEQTYDFDDAAPDDRYPRARGFTNPYGDVRSLVETHDDRFAILVAGDAVTLEFAAPPVTPNTTRTWFLKISGWAKESSFHNKTGEEIAPLPFRAMTAYPPPAGERSPWSDAGDVLTREIRKND